MPAGVGSLVQLRCLSGGLSIYSTCRWVLSSCTARCRVLSSCSDHGRGWSNRNTVTGLSNCSDSHGSWSSHSACHVVVRSRDPLRVLTSVEQGSVGMGQAPALFFRILHLFGGEVPKLQRCPPS